MTAVSLKNVRVVRSSWLEEGGRRLDCNPYMSGALEARDALRRLAARKDPLRTLTNGFGGGIFNGPQFARLWVNDRRFGVRFLSNSDMGNADLSALPLLSNRIAYSRQLKHLELTAGTTLISCSGTIGRMCYVRPDMIGMWSSQHIMKVVPDESRVPPGYLYSFLSSKFGVPLIVAGTYGAVIQHIEPSHIADLPVPRFGPDVELKVDALVASAARKLSDFQTLVEEATEDLFAKTGVINPSVAEWKNDRSDLGFEVSSRDAEPLRAWNQSMRVAAISNSIRKGSHSILGDVIDLDWLRWRVMFKRIDADEEHGIEVLSQRPLFNLFPEGRWISRKYLLNHSPGYIVPDRTILIAKQGTLGDDELFCRCEFVTGRDSLSRAYTDYCMRVVANPATIESGYLFAFLRSQAGFRLLRGVAEGTKQQDLHWRTVPKLLIPRLPRPVEKAIADKVYLAYERRHEGVAEMQSAIALVEAKIRAVGA